jgi:hypothetical protein
MGGGEGCSIETFGGQMAVLDADGRGDKLMGLVHGLLLSILGWCWLL